MQKYWAVIEGDGDNYGAFVPDIFGAVGAGSTAEEAVEGLRESLAVMLADLQGRGEQLPAPTPRERINVSEFGPAEPYRFIEVEPVQLNPISLAIERELKRSGLSKGEFAHRMGVKQPMVSRIIDPTYWGHSSETLRKVARALGAEMQVTFERSPQRREASPFQNGGTLAS